MRQQLLLLVLVSSFVGPSISVDETQVQVKGFPNPGGFDWADSYIGSDGKCYCDINTFDHGIGTVVVPVGNGQWWRVQDVCETLTPPGVSRSSTSPLYNDVQCGNGPPNDNFDEHWCPGRVDLGREGCGRIGPKWDLSRLPSDSSKDKKMKKPASAHKDITVVLGVLGMKNPRHSWADSYSRDGKCYCITSFDHDADLTVVNTPFGWKTQKEVCDMLGRGPGRLADSPIYNDLQCGNGPPNSAGDEHRCPGRVDIGAAGCGQIGPKWAFNNIPATRDECKDCPDLPNAVFEDINDPQRLRSCAWLTAQTGTIKQSFCEGSPSAKSFCSETCGVCTVPSHCFSPPPPPPPPRTPSTPRPTRRPTEQPTPRPTPFPTRRPVEPRSPGCVDPPGEFKMGNKYRTCAWLSEIQKYDALMHTCENTEAKNCKKTCGTC